MFRFVNATKSCLRRHSVSSDGEIFSFVGRVLRTDVIADTIRSLQIVTKTHELYLEEAPEEFTVRAYDDQGNEFRYVLWLSSFDVTVRLCSS